ncbi:MAG: cysteine--tRNA ligase [Patescibacteria group bacterium]
MIELKIFNTLTRKKEVFEPINPNLITYYHCGPTVYSYQHIGNIRSAFISDIVVRTLKFFGYNVRFVTNMTDVGHLDGDNDGDADTGTDRMEKAIKNLPQDLQKIIDRNKNLSLQVANFFGADFLRTANALNLITPEETGGKRTRPTEEIFGQIEMVQELLDKNYAYITKSAIYFDTSKFKNYGKFSGQNLEEKQTAKRGVNKKTGEEQKIILDPEKKSQTDFALWFFTVGNHKNHELRWNSPWGEGFPGWHIECSQMSKRYLVDENSEYPKNAEFLIDIHSGGKEHIPIHHENEIAQTESATGKRFSKYWLHLEHLTVDGKKMSKSLGNVYTVFKNPEFDSLENHGFDPLDLRMLFLQAHYKTAQDFTWKNLQSARSFRLNLIKNVQIWTNRSLTKKCTQNFPNIQTQDILQKFRNAIFDDLHVENTIPIISELIETQEQKITSTEKLSVIFIFDEILKLNLKEESEKIVNLKNRKEVLNLITTRTEAKQSKNFTKSDEIRKNLLENFGVILEDTKDETDWYLKP